MLRMLKLRAARGLLVLAATLAAQACASDQNSAGLLAVPGGMANTGEPDVPPAARGEITVCSFTQDGIYQLTVNGVQQTPFFILADNCVLARTSVLSTIEKVTVTQNSQTGVSVDSVLRVGIIGAVSDSVGKVASSAGMALSVKTFLANEYGAVVVYYNTF